MCVLLGKKGRETLTDSPPPQLSSASLKRRRPAKGEGSPPPQSSKAKGRGRNTARAPEREGGWEYIVPRPAHLPLAGPCLIQALEEQLVTFLTPAFSPFGPTSSFTGRRPFPPPLGNAISEPIVLSGAVLLRGPFSFSVHPQLNTQQELKCVQPPNQDLSPIALEPASNEPDHSG